MIYPDERGSRSETYQRVASFRGCEAKARALAPPYSGCTSMVVLMQIRAKIAKKLNSSRFQVRARCSLPLPCMHECHTAFKASTSNAFWARPGCNGGILEPDPSRAMRRFFASLASVAGPSNEPASKL